MRRHQAAGPALERHLLYDMVGAGDATGDARVERRASGARIDATAQGTTDLFLILPRLGQRAYGPQALAPLFAQFAKSVDVVVDHHVLVISASVHTRNHANRVAVVTGLMCGYTGSNVPRGLLQILVTIRIASTFDGVRPRSIGKRRSSRALGPRLLRRRQSMSDQRKEISCDICGGAADETVELVFYPIKHEDRPADLYRANTLRNLRVRRE